MLARDEEPQPTTQESMFNYVRLSDGGPRRHDGPAQRRSKSSPHRRSLARRRRARRRRQRPHRLDSIGRRCGHTRRIREAIAAVVPGFEQIAEIDRDEERIPDRRPHVPHAAVPHARRPARICTRTSCPNCQGTGDRRDSALMTIRSEGQFNTVVYEDYDLYRGIDRRDVILLHPDDIRRLRLEDGDRVTIHGPAGSMHGILATAFPEIKPGNAAMYYPECNVLVAARSIRKAKRRRSSA